MTKSDLKNRLVVALLIAGFAVLVVALIRAPKPVNWSVSYSGEHDIPYGTKLVYQVADGLFPNQRIVVSHSRMTDFLKETVTSKTNFVFINDDFEPDSQEISTLINNAIAGNHIYIAAEKLGLELADTLKIQIERPLELFQVLKGDSIGFNFTNAQLKKGNHYWYSRRATNNSFSSYDSIRTTVLGHNHMGRTNFIRIKRGEGYIYINCNPVLFTNYHLLANDKSEYIFKSLSYLPVAETVWDEYYKTGRPVITSQMQFILLNPALRMAWYLLLMGVILFFIFRGKRQQSAIPVIERPVNTSLSFVETVSRLYFVRQDHKGIAYKRLVYFKEFIKARYYVDISAPESRIIEEISKKAGVSERSVASLFKISNNLEKVGQISQEDLQQFNRQLEFFYKNCH